MRKGIILEMDDSFLTLMTPEGEFLRAHRNKRLYSVGEEITFEPVMASSPKWKNVFGGMTRMKRTWTAAAAALIIMGSAVLPIQQSNKVYAYMSIDVNPSIELGVNGKMQVVKMHAYNDEGKKIVAEIDDWKKEDVTEVAEDILSEIERQGFFEETNKVIISAVNVEDEELTEKKLERTIGDITKAAEKGSHEVKVVEGTAKDLEEARKQGLTTGKYKAAEEAKEAAGKPAAVPAASVTLPSAAPSVVPGQDKKEGTNAATPPGLEKKQDPSKPAADHQNGNNGQENKKGTSDRPGNSNGKANPQNVKKNETQGELKKDTKYIEKNSNKSSSKGNQGNKRNQNEKKTGKSGK